MLFTPEVEACRVHTVKGSSVTDSQWRHAGDKLGDALKTADNIKYVVS